MCLFACNLYIIARAIQVHYRSFRNVDLCVRILMNQHTRELIKARKTSHKHNNEKHASAMVTLPWHASEYKVHKLHQGLTSLLGNVIVPFETLMYFCFAFSFLLFFFFVTFLLVFFFFFFFFFFL